VQRASQNGNAIHILLSDIVMPGLSGVQLAAVLLPRHPGMKVIFMSGYSRENLAAPSIRSLHAAYVSKPFTAETLVAAVRGVLDGVVPRTRPQ
jgi:DNA-binding NtrC family response regulator